MQCIYRFYGLSFFCLVFDAVNRYIRFEEHGDSKSIWHFPGFSYKAGAGWCLFDGFWSYGDIWRYGDDWKLVLCNAGRSHFQRSSLLFWCYRRNLGRWHWQSVVHVEFGRIELLHASSWWSSLQSHSGIALRTAGRREGSCPRREISEPPHPSRGIHEPAQERRFGTDHMLHHPEVRWPCRRLRLRANGASWAQCWVWRRVSDNGPPLAVLKPVFIWFDFSLYFILVCFFLFFCGTVTVYLFLFLAGRSCKRLQKHEAWKAIMGYLQ